MGSAPLDSGPPNCGSPAKKLDGALPPRPAFLDRRVPDPAVGRQRLAWVGKRDAALEATGHSSTRREGRSVGTVHRWRGGKLRWFVEASGRPPSEFPRSAA